MTAHNHIIFLITIVAPFLLFNIDSVAPCLPSKIAGDVDLLSSDYRGAKSEGRDGATGQWKEIVHKESGIVLRLVPAGEFDMGLHISVEEAARKYGGYAGHFIGEHPLHRVKISEPFYIGKYEVTNEQFCKFLNAKAAHSGGGNSWLDVYYDEDCRIEKREGEYRPMSGYAEHPVTLVSWWGAKAFSEWAGGRLPSEAEWEYASRAGTKTQWSFGDDESVLGEYAWHWDNSGRKTHEVGQKKPNAWGIYDMYGNVWEWCEDVWHGNYHSAPSDGSAWTSGGDQSGRVRRGGSWGSWRSTRSTVRSRGEPGDEGSNIGFRVVVAAGAVRSFDEVLDDMKFENAPTLGPLIRKYIVAEYRGEWEKVWDMLPGQEHRLHEETWEFFMTEGVDEGKEMANKAGNAKKYYVLYMKMTEESQEEWVKAAIEFEMKFDVVGEEFSDDGKTGWLKVKNLKTGKEEKKFRHVKEGGEWKRIMIAVSEEERQD